MKKNILVVDDAPNNLRILIGILSQDYNIVVATNGKKALEISLSNDLDLILLDVMMPEMDGFEVCRQLKSHLKSKDIPVIFVTAKSDMLAESTGFSVGGVDYITKPYNPVIIKSRIKAQLALFEKNQRLEVLVKQRTQEVENTQLKLIRKLGKAAEYKDNETGLHVIRMSLYVKELAQKISDDEQWIDLIYHASPMHDLGKIGIPDKILSKKGKLDAEEWEIMKTHSVIGEKIIGQENSPLLSMAAEIALSHHEKYDGSGYPNGLSGENIPLTARVVAIADVFDALTSERPYKKAWSITDSLAFLTDNVGNHFDPKLVPLFLDCLPNILQIHENFKDEKSE